MERTNYLLTPLSLSLLTPIQPPTSNIASIAVPRPLGEQYQAHLYTDRRKASIATGKPVYYSYVSYVVML
jgi:hypothetical protein